MLNAPAVIVEFADKARRVAELHGVTGHEGRKHYELLNGPLFIFALEDPDELFVSVPGPQDNTYARAYIFQSVRHGLHFDRAMCEQTIPLLDKLLVLDNLAGI